MAICIIPARSGSKRIANKNIKLFLGKPIIAYSIECALQSQIFDQVIVSTDCEHIQQISKEYGAQVPFLRPKEISDDFSTTADVMQHAARWVKKNYKKTQLLCCLYATSPLITTDNIINGFQQVKKKGIDYAFSITEFSFPIQRSLSINSKDIINANYPENMLKRSQDLQKNFHDAGQFYWGKVDNFIEKKSFYSGSTKAVILPNYQVCDIDDEQDWKKAEIQYQLLQKLNKNE